MIYILIEKIVVVITQPTHDVSGTSPEDHLIVLKSKTCMGLSGNSQGNNTKIDEKLFRVRDMIITYSYSSVSYKKCNQPIK